MKGKVRYVCKKVIKKTNVLVGHQYTGIVLDGDYYLSKHWPNAGTVLGQRLRKWANIVPTLAEHLVLLGYRNPYITLLRNIDSYN